MNLGSPPPPPFLQSPLHYPSKQSITTMTITIQESTHRQRQRDRKGIFQLTLKGKPKSTSEGGNLIQVQAGPAHWRHKGVGRGPSGTGELGDGPGALPEEIVLRSGPGPEWGRCGVAAERAPFDQEQGGCRGTGQWGESDTTRRGTGGNNGVSHINRARAGDPVGGREWGC